MKSSESPDLTAVELVALRDQPDALKLITERLKVKQMGPADHIRTKHEVKALIESGGGLSEATAIVARAQARRQLQETHAITQKMTERQQRGQRMGD